MAVLTLEARSEAEVALELSRDRVLSLQDEQGWWRGELLTNVTMDAEDMLLREFLGIRRADETERSAAWIRSQQRADGTWANFHGGPGDVSTTVEAYWALRLAGEDPGAAHMSAAAEFVRAHGGVEAARVFTHLWLALFGLWSWDRVPALPAEGMLLPASLPLNVYAFACWARQTIVALSIVKAHRPVGFDNRERHDRLAGPAREGVDVQREARRQQHPLRGQRGHAVPGPEAEEREPQVGEHARGLHAAMRAHELRGRAHVGGAGVLAGEAQRPVGLHCGRDVAGAAVEVRPGPVRALL